MAVDRTDLQRALRRPPAPIDYAGASRAAVAAMVTPAMELVFIRRARHEADPWSGHVSFPGGRMEESDASPLAAALRETGEEIGVGLTSEMLLGGLDEVPTVSPLPRLVVHPFVFVLPETPAFHPNYEVASVHTVSLEALLAGTGRSTMRHPWRGRHILLPRVAIDGQQLWGLTLRMVDDLLDRLDGRGLGLQRPPG